MHLKTVPLTWHCKMAPVWHRKMALVWHCKMALQAPRFNPNFHP